MIFQKELRALNYRRLEAGEIIRQEDEYDSGNYDNRHATNFGIPKWIPSNCVGKAAPNPQYPAHRQYRRSIH